MTAGARVGLQIKQRREQRGLTAAELARRAGLGKASLSSIEAGRGNPTIDTLYAIAFALRIPLTDLLAEDEPAGTVHRPHPRRPPAEATRELLRRITAGESAEIWRVRMPPHTVIDGVPHAAGTREHLLVASGVLFAGVRGDERALHPGDLLAYDGDTAHSYRTEVDAAEVTVLLVAPLREPSGEGLLSERVGPSTTSP